MEDNNQDLVAQNNVSNKASDDTAKTIVKKRSNVEKTFGARLARAEGLIVTLSTFNNYIALRNEDSITEMTTYIASIKTLNTSLTTAMRNYNTATTERQQMFRTNAISLDKMLAPIGAYIKGMYGVKSTQYNQAITIIKKIRGNKLITILATDTTEERTYSQSARSYGSSIDYFRELIDTIATFANFDPPAVHLKRPALTSFLNDLTTKNNQVTNLTAILKPLIVQRQSSFEDLHNRVQRIKSTVMTTYGNGSVEHNLIKGLAV